MWRCVNANGRGRGEGRRPFPPCPRVERTLQLSSETGMTPRAALDEPSSRGAIAPGSTHKHVNEAFCASQQNFTVRGASQSFVVLVLLLVLILLVD